MKKPILIFTLLALSSTVISQTELTRVYSTEGKDVKHVYENSGNDNFTYSTENEFYFYKALDDDHQLRRESDSTFNDIHGSFGVIGDTLSIYQDFYGMDDGSLRKGGGGSLTSSDIGIKSITHNGGDTVYVYSKDGTDRKIYLIDKDTGDPITLININAVYNFDGYENITFFKDAGSEYLLFTGEIITNEGLPTEQIDEYAIYNLDTDGVILGNDNIQNAAYSEGNGLYYNIDETIYKLDDINNLQNGTPTFSVPNNLQINDISVNNTTLWGEDFKILVATPDGVYTNEISLNFEGEKETFDNVSLYPNPNNGKFTISNLKEESSINIYNAFGQKVYSAKNLNKTSFKVNVELPSGFYTVRVKNGEGVVNKKVVIK